MVRTKKILYFRLLLLLLAVCLSAVVSVRLLRPASPRVSAPAAPEAAPVLPGAPPAGVRVQPRGGVSPATGSGSPAAASAGAAAAAPAVAPLRPRRPSGPIPGEHVLGFYNVYDRDRFIELARQRGIEVLDSLPLGNAVRVRVSDPAILDAVLEEGPRAVRRALNQYTLTPEPPDQNPRLPEAGYLAFGARALEWLGVEGVTAEWGAGVKIAVLDTAVSRQAGLSEANLTRVSFVAGSEGAEGVAAGHGTAVASIILGTSTGVAGIAPAADVIAIAVMTPDGVGDSFTLARGILEAVNRGAQVINISLGSYADTFVVSDAVEYALRRGVAVVAAVGNDAVEGLLYPAAYAGVVPAAAADAAERHLYFSNRGSGVALAAPGYGVAVAAPDGRVRDFSGTSAAAPFIAGAVAALVGLQDGLAPADAVDLLTAYSDDAGPAGRDDELGSGVLNLARVLEREQPGIYDLSVSAPYVRPPASAGADAVVEILAQNRGTEPIEALRFEIDANGERSEVRFTGLRVGESVSRRLTVPAARLAQPYTLRLVYGAAIEGRPDNRPANNARSVTLVLGGGSGG